MLQYTTILSGNGVGGGGVCGGGREDHKKPPPFFFQFLPCKEIWIRMNYLKSIFLPPAFYEAVKVRQGAKEKREHKGSTPRFSPFITDLYCRCIKQDMQIYNVDL